MKIYVIASGSKGNATIIENDGRILLIDMGITLIRLKEALNSIGKRLIDIEALLLTHNHSDHVCGVKYLDPLPIYCIEGTYDNLNVNTILLNESFNLIGLEIEAIEASHDAPNTIGFIIKNDNEKLVYMTDTGMIPEHSLIKMKNATYYVIESNHNRKMLMKTNRPAYLKLRIMSDQGHLANEDSAIYMSELVGNKTKQIILAHLSQEANTPELAMKAYDKIFKKCHICMENFKIICAKQDEIVIGGQI